MDATTLIPLNPRDYLVLLSLTEEDRHGYGIVKDIEQQSGGSVSVDPANLYRTLKRMIASGLVAPAEARPGSDDGDERRRYYRITPFGEEVVKLEAARLAELTAIARSRQLLAGTEPTG